MKRKFTMSSGSHFLTIGADVVPILLRLVIILSVALSAGATTFVITDMSQYFPAGALVIPSGINDSGEIVGNYWTTTGTTSTQHGFTLQNGVLQTLNGMIVGGINNLGQFVGNGPGGPFIGTSAGITYPNIPDVVAFNGINDLGEVVGTGFTYQSGVLTPISIGGNYTVAKGINDAGQIVGFYDVDGSPVAFEESGSTLNVLFPDLVGSSSAAYGINNNGVIVGTGSFGSFYDVNGTLYDAGNIFAVNDLGQTVGIGSVNGEGPFSVYVATPVPDVPEPAAWMLIVTSFSDLGVFSFLKARHANMADSIG